MTKLEAVNRMLRALHEYPVAALDTGGVSTAASAETILDECDKSVQAKGWHCNRENDVVIEPATVTKMALPLAAVAWTAATRTLTKADAFATWAWAGGDQIHVTGGTGVTAGWYAAEKTGDDTVVLATSIADSDNADTTTDLVGWEDAITFASDILRADAYLGSAYIDTVKRGDHLYNCDDNTFSFDGNVTLTLIRKLSFAHLPIELQELIVAEGAIELQDFAVAGRVKDAVLRDRAARALLKARRAEQDVAQKNVLESDYALRLQGQSYISQHVRR